MSPTPRRTEAHPEKSAEVFSILFPLRILLLNRKAIQSRLQQNEQLIEIAIPTSRSSMSLGFILSFPLVGFVAANPFTSPSAHPVVVVIGTLSLKHYLSSYPAHRPASRFGCLMLLPVRNPIRREMSTSLSSRKVAESFLSDGKKKPASVVFACGRMAYLTGVEPVTF